MGARSGVISSFGSVKVKDIFPVRGKCVIFNFGVQCLQRVWHWRQFLCDISSRGQSPSVERVQKLAAYLGVTTSELLGEKIEPTPVIEGGLSEEQQELVSLYTTAPSDFRRATLEMLRSAARPGTGVNDGWATVQIKDPSVKPVKVLGVEPVAVEAVVPVAGKVKKLPYGRAAVRSKKRAKSRGKARGGPFKGK